MNELEQLKQLVLDGGYDEESRKQVADLEARLQRIAVAENLKANPIIGEYIDYLDAEKSRCTLLLSRNRTLTEVERLVLFEKRDLCEKFSSLFTGEAKQAIEQEINDLLDAAKNS